VAKAGVRARDKAKDKTDRTVFIRIIDLKAH